MSRVELVGTIGAALAIAALIVLAIVGDGAVPLPALVVVAAIAIGQLVRITRQRSGRREHDGSSL